MNNQIVIINIYTSLNNTRIRGRFPMYMAGISKCCVDSTNKQTITPINFIVT